MYFTKSKKWISFLSLFLAATLLATSCAPAKTPTPTPMPPPTAVPPTAVPPTVVPPTKQPEPTPVPKPASGLDIPGVLLSQLPDVDLKTLAGQVEGKLGRKPKIAITSFSRDNDWAIQIFAGAENMAKELGAEVIGTNAKSDSNQQVTDITNAIQAKVDALLVPGGYAAPLLPVIQKAKEQGIVVITADIPSPYSDCNVTTDSFGTGATVALRMAADLKGQGNIAFLYTPGWHTTDVRVAQYREVIKEFPGLQVTVEQPTDFPNTVAKAMERVENIIQGNPDAIQAVMVGWGLPALGAAKAIEAAGLQDKIGVYAVDGDIEILREIAKGGAFKATIAQDPLNMGKTMVTMAYLVMAGRGNEVPTEYYTPIYLVTKENAELLGPVLYGDLWK